MNHELSDLRGGAASSRVLPVRQWLQNSLTSSECAYIGKKAGPQSPAFNRNQTTVGSRCHSYPGEKPSLRLNLCLKVGPTQI